MELTSMYEENVVVETVASEAKNSEIEETGRLVVLETEKIEQLQIACYKLFLATSRVSAHILRVARLRTSRCTMNRIFIGPVISKPLPGPRVQMR